MIFGASELVGSSLNLNNPVPGLPDVDVLLSYSYIIEIPASCPDVPAEPELPALPAEPALPVEPEVPVEPDDPVEPDVPAEPLIPASPVRAKVIRRFVKFVID